VILHLEESEYRVTDGWASDPSQVTLWGQRGVAYSVTDWGSTNIGFVIKTNTRDAIRDGDLTGPTFSKHLITLGPTPNPAHRPQPLLRHRSRTAVSQTTVITAADFS